MPTATRSIPILFTTVLLAASCGGGDGTGPDPAPQTPARGSISGSVTNAGVGVPGVAVTLGGAASRSATSSSAGSFAFADLVPGGYTVSIVVPAGMALAAGAQASRSVTVAAGGTATIGFALVAQGGAATVIDVQASAFAPRDISIARGTRVRWTNNSGIMHTVTPDGHAEWQSADLNHGQVFEHVFDAAGTFNYYCEPHRSAGMTGVIRVQ